MEITKKGIVLIVIIILLISSSCAVLFNTRYFPDEEVPKANMPEKAEKTEPENTAATELSAFDVVKKMGVGWNLGSTLESIDNNKRGILSEFIGSTPEVFYETYWGNPVTTAAMVDSVAKAGFGAIRIPVTYTDHMDGNFVIRREWLERVEQVVNYVLDNDIYCIINIHHDTGSGRWPWLKADAGNIENLEKQFAAVWKQIAEHFKDYNNKLIFEAFNEILDLDDNWVKSGDAAYDAVNRLNQVFVDTVRGTGGENADRFLIIKSYSASVDSEMLDSFVVPRDSKEGKLIFSFHYYGLHEFILQQNQAKWTTTYADWDQQRDGRPVELLMERASTKLKGIPVIIGEFGAQNKGNTNARIQYATHFIKTAAKYGISCFWWDNGGKYENAYAVRNYALLDRYNNQWFFPELVEAMVKAANESKLHAP